MNIKWNVFYLGAILALTTFMTPPAMADEWNKRTELQFSGPVEIPGRVLAAGKYVFELADDQADRNIVQVYSKDSNGRETLVETILAVPDYTQNTPDKAIVHFEERKAGAPQAIHSWYYPGDNTGWQFIYPKGQTKETSMNTTPATVTKTAAAAPSLPSPPVEGKTAIPQASAVEEEVLTADEDAPAAPPAQEADVTPTGERVLPETAGDSGLDLIAGIAMLLAGTATLFAFRRRALA